LALEYGKKEKWAIGFFVTQESPAKKDALGEASLKEWCGAPQLIHRSGVAREIQTKRQKKIWLLLKAGKPYHINQNMSLFCKATFKS